MSLLELSVCILIKECLKKKGNKSKKSSKYSVVVEKK